MRLGVSFQVVNGSVESGGSGAGGATDFIDVAGKGWMLLLFLLFLFLFYVIIIITPL